MLIQTDLIEIKRKPDFFQGRREEGHLHPPPALPRPPGERARGVRCLQRGGRRGGGGDEPPGGAPRPGDRQDALAQQVRHPARVPRLPPLPRSRGAKGGVRVEDGVGSAQQEQGGRPGERIILKFFDIFPQLHYGKTISGRPVSRRVHPRRPPCPRPRRGAFQRRRRFNTEGLKFNKFANEARIQRAGHWSNALQVTALL